MHNHDNESSRHTRQAWRQGHGQESDEGATQRGRAPRRQGQVGQRQTAKPRVAKKHCRRCGHRWVQEQRIVKECPSCKSATWDDREPKPSTEVKER